MRVWRNGSRMGLKIPGSRERGGSNPLTRTNYEELVEVAEMFDNTFNVLDTMAICVYINAISNFHLFNKNKH